MGIGNAWEPTELETRFFSPPEECSDERRLEGVPVPVPRVPQRGETSLGG